MTSVCHIVLVSWKSGAGAHAEEIVRPAARRFVDTIPGVLAVTEGHSASPEGLEGGFDYGLVVTFASATARDVYLDHPDHLPVAAAIGAAAERVLVFDI
ncbi:MAG TPA: Dabb family protein [Microlunatus sp.]